MDKNILVGKTITKFIVALDRQSIEFKIKGGEPVVGRVYADCCSTTWIESLDTPKALLGKVQAVEDIAMTDLGSLATETNPNPECVSYYGKKITTNKGVCVIDFRNNSNGYYGGRLDIV